MGIPREIPLPNTCVCVLVTSTRLHAQKHLWHDRGESSPATAQEDAQQHTARTLKTLQNRSRDSRTEGVLTREAKTGTKKQQHAGEHPARDPPGTAHHCVRAKYNPRGAAARRVRVQPLTPQPAPAPTKTPPHMPGRAAETPGAPRALHHRSHPSTPTAGGSRVPATTATVLHVPARRAT